MGWIFTAVRRGGAAAAGLLALTVPFASAQAEEPTAPRVTRPGGALQDRAILVEGYGYWPRDEQTPLRTAQPLAEPVTWFVADSVLAKAHLADPAAPRDATILLDITAQGTIAGCRYSPRSRVIVEEGLLCAEIAGQRFLPKLADDGTQVAGTFTLSFSNRTFTAQPDGPPRPLFTNERDTRPVPRLASRVQDLERFPPADFQVADLYRAPQWKTAPQAGWGETPQAGPMTGLILHRGFSGLECRVLQPSGDMQADAAACAYGRGTLAPNWSSVDGNRDWMVPLAILHRPEGPLAIGPDPDFVRETQLAEGAEDALVAALTRAGVLPQDRAKSPLVLDLAANPDGSVRHCRVVKTTGKDATDIAACKTAREAARLMPFEDVFGTPNPLASLFWRAAPAAP
ncbi:MAG: hypothetical protein NBV68_02315 [Erythrobacter sp.]|uniref:hypothetical protein n=1 Tax=Erythrobacter sp. TaxID=1042 RepID=UPI0025CF645A|nr:hypothetical protein [Erythrobacter sp.]MCL9998191.1 hypothetical protein [Erythrobacter sp.]